jgi:hypothetical protein
MASIRHASALQLAEFDGANQSIFYELLTVVWTTTGDKTYISSPN